MGTDNSNSDTPVPGGFMSMNDRMSSTFNVEGYDLAYAVYGVSIQRVNNLDQHLTGYEAKIKPTITLPKNNAYHITSLLSIISGSQEFIYATEPKSGRIFSMKARQNTQFYPLSPLELLLDTTQKFPGVPETCSIPFTTNCIEDPKHAYCQFNNLQGLVGY